MEGGNRQDLQVVSLEAEVNEAKLRTFDFNQQLTLALTTRVNACHPRRKIHLGFFGAALNKLPALLQPDD